MKKRLQWRSRMKKHSKNSNFQHFFAIFVKFLIHLLASKSQNVEHGINCLPKTLFWALVNKINAVFHFKKRSKCDENC